MTALNAVIVTGQQAKPDKLQSYSDFSAECFQYNFLRFWSMSEESDEMKGNNDE